jgi:HEPN domain-containing protein
MDRQEEFRQWFGIADDDLRSAEYLATMTYPRPEGIICFHCQQSAEKYLKGFLFQNTVDPPKTHDLMVLLELCKQASPSLGTLLDQCVFLNRYSVIPRYPDELQITSDDVSKAIQYANIVKEFVTKAVSCS